jgi:uncharacterized protein involved in outer membrane biogenesis
MAGFPDARERCPKMRALKIAGLIVAGLAALSLLGVVALFVVVNPNSYRGQIERLVLRQTGRQLSIAGPLELRLFPRIAIAVSDARLGNRAGFGEAPFLTLRRASIGVRLWPILRRQFIVSRIDIEGLALRLVSRNARENNWQDLFSSNSQAPPPNSAAGAAGAQASIAGVDVSDSSLSYQDEAQHTTSAITGLTLHTGPIGSGVGVPVKLALDYGSGTGRPAHVTLSANVQLSPGGATLALTKVDAGYDELHVRGEARVDDLAASRTSFELSSDELNVDALLAGGKAAPPRAAPAAGGAAPAAPVELPLAALRRLDTHGTLRIERLIFERLVFGSVTLPLAAADGRVHLGTAQANLAGGRGRADIVVDARGAQAQLSVSAHLEDVDVGALTQTLSGSARLSGRAVADGNFSGAGATDVALRRALAGKFNATVSGGALNGVDLVYEIKAAQALLKGEAPPARSGPVRTTFKELTTSGTLAGNVVHDEALHAATDFLSAQGSGTYDLASGAVNYHLTAQLAGLPPSSGNLAALANAPIPIDITGKLGALAVRPDLEQLARTQARQELNRRLGDQRDQVKQKLNETLQQLFKH